MDEAGRTIYFQGVGKESGPRSVFPPVLQDRLRRQGQTLLTPEDGDHTIDLSPSGKYFVDTYSKPDAPPVSVLRDASGKVVADAREGRHLAARRRRAGSRRCRSRSRRATARPISTGCCSGRRTSTRRSAIRSSTTSIPDRRPAASAAAASPPARGDAQAIAELGFIVVQIDGMGTPWRSRTFHEAYYGDMGDNTLPDQVAGMKELASRYPWIDLDRAGIYGHSGGGFATAGAMFRYPDFFKVGVSQAGNHDNRDLRGRLGREVAGAAGEEAGRHQQLRRPGESESRQEPEGQAAARARDDGHQRAVLQHAARRRRADQGEQGLRPDHVPEPRITASAASRTWCGGAGIISSQHLLGAEPPANYEMRGPQAARPTTSQAPR